MQRRPKKGSFFFPLSQLSLCFLRWCVSPPSPTPRLAPTAFVVSAANAVGVFGLWACGGWGSPPWHAGGALGTPSPPGLDPRYPPPGPSGWWVTGFWPGEMASLGIRFGFGLRVCECVLRLRCVVRVLVFFGGGLRASCALVRVAVLCFCGCLFVVDFFLEQGRPIACFCLFCPSLVLRVRCCGPLCFCCFLLRARVCFSLPSKSSASPPSLLSPFLVPTRDWITLRDRDLHSTRGMSIWPVPDRVFWAICCRLLSVDWCLLPCSGL